MTYYIGGTLDTPITSTGASGTITFEPGDLVVDVAGLVSTAEKHQALVTTGWSYISVHSASPSTSGANEIASSTRGAVTWSTPSGGQVTNTNTVTVGFPPSSTATHFGVQSTAS